MISSITRKMVLLGACWCICSLSAIAQDVPNDYQEVLKSLDRKGDFKDGVLKVNIPRNDLYAPEQEEDSKPVARMVVYEAVPR